ncbi:MAG: hypothetical protein RLZZ484_1146 [Pseudomonadota bacterium]|jgi:uncharacterized protein YneF (UPF0154 family)
MFGILVLSLLAGAFVIGGMWIATQDTKPVEKHPDGQNVKP